MIRDFLHRICSTLSSRDFWVRIAVTAAIFGVIVTLKVMGVGQ